MNNIFQPNYLKYLGLVVLGFLASASVRAQDLHFSQFFETPLLRNPSLAGLYTGDVRARLLYRNQWNSATAAYKTFAASGEYKTSVGQSDDFLTLGLQLLHDQAGTVAWTSSHVLPALNYHKSLSSETNRYLSLGFMGGPVQRRLDLSKVTTESQYYGRGLGENTLTPQYTYFDGTVGMSYSGQLDENPDNNLVVGLAYHHFTKPKNSFLRDKKVALDPKWVGSVGVKLAVQETGYLNLQADYSVQGGSRQAVMGALYGIKLNQEVDNPQYVLHGGAFLRWNDAFIPVVKLDYRPVSFSFSYDVNISRLKTATRGRGGFEAGITYTGFIREANYYSNYPRF
ncbi:PorP/SprF family type IX secretion system membrane protein [Paraflavisolibacter sp. H34]|uniref:PorP/SprF family type IX secretion system membrane protein n=1 Tax=Huijunlia imazamoxiresistens TaxID=3127457 RepID=UPI003019BBCC